MPAHATLELSNVSFEAPGFDPVLVEAHVIEMVYVGWLPG